MFSLLVVSTVRDNWRSPQQWRDAIDLIENVEVRARVACIVWWDYFGGQSVRKRWGQLDVYLKMPVVPMKNSVIEAGLIIAGYTPTRAKSRIAKSLDYDEEVLISRRIYGPHKNLFKRKSYVNHSNNGNQRSP
jgi:hypothetical protein